VNRQIPAAAIDGPVGIEHDPVEVLVLPGVPQPLWRSKYELLVRPVAAPALGGDLALVGERGLAPGGFLVPAQVVARGVGEDVPSRVAGELGGPGGAAGPRAHGVAGQLAGGGVVARVAGPVGSAWLRADKKSPACRRASLVGLMPGLLVEHFYLGNLR
jgi:hypothetical protein